MAFMLLSVLVLALVDYSLAALDNKGTEFILTFPENFQRQQHDPRLFFSCPHPSGAEVTVSLPSSGHHERVRVRHGQVKKVELDRVEVELRGSQKTDDYRTVHITSDVEIVVYGVFAERASSDAYLALPTDGLGTEYFVSCSSIVRNYNSEGFLDIPSEFGVAGVHDGTTVTIVPSQAVTFDGQNYAAGQEFSVRLDRFETLQVQASEDLTGSKITASHPVAVLSGNLFAFCRPMDETQRGTGDHIVEMIPPVDTWGKEFVTVPLAMHTGGDLFRVVAARDNTQVNVTNENTTTLNAGEFWEIDVPSDEYRHVTSSEPVLLVQYSKTGASDSTDTDPFMMIIPPVAQFQSEYTFATVELVLTTAVPGSRSTHHINLVVRSADKAGLLLDGQRLPSDTDWHDVPGTDYAAAQMTISAETHTVRHLSPISTIGLFSYGFVKPESYGYPGGLRLARIAASCSATAPVPGDRQDNDCDGRVDEELLNGRDDDGDGLVDEDLAASNCADHRDRYRECLVQRCRNLAP
ncbi:IgGFc-binding protein-like [Branchiostoma floridae x Branchiostoma belcheri]